jgi:hypothetical protein
MMFQQKKRIFPIMYFYKKIAKIKYLDLKTQPEKVLLNTIPISAT